MIKQTNQFWTGSKNDFVIVIWSFLTETIKTWAATKHWNRINRGRFTSPVTSSIQIDMLQPWTIVAKSFMLHVTGLMDPPLIKDSVTTLKSSSFTYVFARVLKSCERSLTKTYSEPSGSVFAKSSIIDVWLGSKYALIEIYFVLFMWICSHHSSQLLAKCHFLV